MEEILGLDVNNDVSTFEETLKVIIPQVVFFLLKVLLALFVLWLGIKLIRMVRTKLLKKLYKLSEEKGAIQFISSVLSIVLIGLLVIVISRIFGITTTAIAAVIGSMALSIGLGFQGSLANFVGGIIIILYKPFKIGDYIIANGGNCEGTVYEIQIFYTKLKKRDNTIVVLPNGSLTNNVIVNNTENVSRRIEVLMPVAYNTDIKLAKACLYKAIDSRDDVLHDMDKLVFIKDFEDSAIILGVRFYVNSQDYFKIIDDLRDYFKEVFDDNNIVIPFNQLEIKILNK